MDLPTAETRARIACRIYLKLFDAGDEGALIVYDDMLDSALTVPRDHATVQHVLQRLCSMTVLARAFPATVTRAA